MRACFARKVIVLAIVLAQSLSLSLLAQAQQTTHEESRPRRIKEAKQQSSEPAPLNETWKVPATETPASIIERAVLVPGPEPKIRVGLATDVRVATVSTTGRLLQTIEAGAKLVALDSPRVRLEPRLLSPLPPLDSDSSFRILVAGAANRDEADQKAREIKETIGEESQVTHDVENNTWGLLVGARRSRAEAEQISERLNDGGFDASVFQSKLPQPNTVLATNQSTSPIRLAARTSVPSREVVAFGSGIGRSFSSSAPVILGSDDETKFPVR
jgi:hypothetical protein